ncbi:MAG: SDR family oxidoreductase [Archaeoglobaceae archaeon]
MKVLLTGATGYIGRRLKQKLLEDESVQLRLFVRNKKKIRPETREKVEIVEGDTFNKEALEKAAEGVDVAYYLIHSLGAGKNFADLDRVSAENFRDACIKAGVKRMIYLGGLGVKESASEHLRSRIETGEVLSAHPDKIQTIWFRAGVIIGSGGASFEIIRNLVQKLPVMFLPKWVRTKSQAIAVDDVIKYLDEAKDLQIDGDLMVDIGSEKLSFQEMLMKTSRVMGLKRTLIPIPVLSPRLSSYWLILFTPVSDKIARSLVDGLKSETVLQNDNASYFDFTPMSFEESIRKAVDEIERKQVVSRWCDSSAEQTCDIKDDNMSRAIYRDMRAYSFDNLPPEKVFTAVKSIGGKDGWFTYDIFWRIGGVIDKLLGGYGLNRGRRDEQDLRVGDSLDFWKVADFVPNKRLLLRSQLSSPGKSWLEFTIEGDKLVQTAYFYPNGILGRVYWWVLKPFHYFTFRDLAKSIIGRARKIETPDKKKLNSSSQV